MTTQAPERPVPFRAGSEPGLIARPMAVPAFTGAHLILADISEFQPSLADAIYLAWSKAVVIRAAYGDAHDDRAWYGGQRRAMLHAGGARFVGCYQYLVAGQSGTAQARAFRSLVGAIEPGEVFIADFEEGDRAVLTNWYAEMLAMYGQGIAPYLWTYSGLWFGESRGVMPVEWIAAYGQSEPSVRHKLWQFTDAYPVPGVGTCDASVFHGSIDELAALAWQGAKPPPTPPPVKPPVIPAWQEHMMQALPTLKQGDKGPAVARAQALVNESRKLRREAFIAQDGDFGPATAAAVREEQAHGHVTRNGEVGPATWPVLLGVA